MSRIADPRDMVPRKHSEALIALHGLMIRIKLEASGAVPWQPLTVQEIAALEKHLDSLEECRDDRYEVKYLM